MMTTGFVLLVVLVGLLTALTGSAAAQSTGFVDLNASDLTGNGTDADPYVITNVSELQAAENNLTAHYEVGNDIDASDTSEWRGGDGFTPIGGFGANKDPFKSTFDGNNNTVSGIVVNPEDTNYIGLFGYVEDASIKNIEIENANVSGNENFGIGGLAGGANNANITNVSVSGAINSNATEIESAAGGIIGDKLGGIVRNSTSSANIHQNTSGAGGLVGDHRNGGKITDSSATGDVDGLRSVGGLVGSNDENSIISASYASGDVTASDRLAGGLVGPNEGVIRNSYALGSVSAGQTVGGLVGSNVGGGHINSSYAAGSINGDALTGGLAGVNRVNTTSSYWDTETTGQDSSDGNATGLSTSEMTGSAAVTNMAGFDFGTIWQTQPNDYPVLASSSGDNSNGEDGDDGDDSSKSTEFVDVDVSDLEGSGTADDPYVITNASELQTIENGLDANYTLASDIDASNTAQWNGGSGFDPVGRFTGSLDGSGYNITGLTIDRPDRFSVGVFSEVDSSSTVTNVSLIDAAVTGDRSVGVLTGYNFGTLQNIIVSGSVIGSTDVGGVAGTNDNEGRIIRSEASTEVNGSSQNIGGLVGQNNGDAIINDSYATGDVTGYNTDVGGLVGRNIGQITDSHATGNINDNDVSPQAQPPDRVGGLSGYNQGNITESYATGAVTGATRVGGLVGVNFDYNDTETVVRSSYATGDVTGTGGSVGGLVGSNFEGSPVGDLVPSLEVRITSSYATGDVTGEENNVGGFIGYNNGTIRQSFAIGKVTGNSSDVGGFVGDNRELIRGSYSVGAVEGENNPGGLAGRNSGTITNSYWDTDSSGQDSSEGGVGLTTSEMTGLAAENNMDGFEFGTVWETQQAAYPRLLTQVRAPPSQSVSVSVVSLEPSTVSSDSPSTHELVLEAEGVSADGEDDQFNITFPDSVTLEGTPEVTVAELSGEPTVTTNGNTMRFTVDPTGEQSTRTLTVTANVTLSANN